MKVHKTFLLGKNIKSRFDLNELDIFDYETFKNNDMKFYAVSTCVNDGKPTYFLINDLKNEKEKRRCIMQIFC